MILKDFLLIMASPFLNKKVNDEDGPTTINNVAVTSTTDRKFCPVFHVHFVSASYTASQSAGGGSARSAAIRSRYRR